MGNEVWRNHLMTVFNDMKKTNSKVKLGDAMIEAKKTYKKQEGGKRKSKRSNKVKRKIKNKSRKKKYSRKSLRK